MKAQQMNQSFHEKILYGVTSLLSGTASAMGAILTDGESRWLFVAITSSIVTSSFLSLVLKKSSETIKVVVGRCGLSMIGGVFGTRYLLHTGYIAIVNDDVILLGAQAAGVTIASFVIGYPLLQIVNANGKGIAEKIFGRFASKADE